MKTRTWLGMALSCLLAGSALSGAVVSENRVTDNAAGTAVVPGKKDVMMGMTKEQLLERVGKPFDVATKPSPAGPVEVWTYRRVLQKYTHQTAATTEKVWMWVGPGYDNDGLREITVPSYRTEDVKIYQMTNFIIKDGKLVAAKQWQQREGGFR